MNSTIQTYYQAAKNNVKTYFCENAIEKAYRDKLPGAGIMGYANYDKASKEIKKFRKQHNYSGMRSYTKNQLNKLKGELKGTNSEGYINDRLRELE